MHSNAFILEINEQLPAPEECSNPNCSCHSWRRPQRLPGVECTLYRPLMLYIPPEGTHISCPAHGQHFLRGSAVTC